jgi:phage antirepressor YoqD-like protein
MKKYGLEKKEIEILNFLRTNKFYHTDKDEYRTINNLGERGFVKIKEKRGFSRDKVYEVKLTESGKSFLKIHKPMGSRLFKQVFDV